MSDFFTKYYIFLKRRIAQAALASDYAFLPLGFLILFGYAGWYLLWQGVEVQVYESLWLRIIASSLGIPLILMKIWPDIVKKFFPIYWYLSLIYLYPFFFTYMFLKNGGSTAWQLNAMSALVLLILVTDWLSVAIVSLIGVSLAVITYIITTPVPVVPPGLSGVVSNYFGIILFCGFFLYRKSKVLKEKLASMELLSATIAHELRTPLRTITSGINAIKSSIDKLMRSYTVAREDKLTMPVFSKTQYGSIEAVLEHMSAEADSAFMVIDMLLVRVGRLDTKLGKMEMFSIVDCVNSALDRYPFDLHERESVHWQPKGNFQFKCNRTLIEHVFFNLLKNALYFVKAAGSGEISIWLDVSDQQHHLHFKDTGAGIAKKDLPHIFERFFTTTKHGTGTGLAFCKMVMKGIGGDIVCHSVQGEYTEFVLTFPVIEHN